VESPGVESPGVESPGVDSPGSPPPAGGCAWLPPAEELPAWSSPVLPGEGLPAVELLEDVELPGDDELLEDELLLDGALVLGVDGVCGVVGLLALGQPLSNRQAQADSASTAYHGVPVLVDFIGPDNFLRNYRLARVETRPEPGFAQLPHDAVGLCLVDVLVVVDPLQVHHAAALGNTEF